VNGVKLMQRTARLLLAASALLLLSGAALWLMQRPLFDLRRIEVRGRAGELQHVAAGAVRAALRGRLRGNYFTLPLDDVRRAFETLPWVAAVSVRRAWPNRLIVTLTEHRALGLWSDGRLLSDAGVLFVANPAEAEIDAPLPEFDGPDRLAGDVVRRYYEFAAALAPLSLAIEAIDVSDRASWSVRLDSGLSIELGRDEPAGRVSERLAAITTNYATVVARLKAAPSRIDARYPNGFAVALPAAPGKS
jgi:cell division protein FtsQ